MLNLNCHIEVINIQTQQALVFDYVTSVEIESSWKNLTDTAKITLPRKLKLQDKLVADVIKKGNPVSIQLGYNGQLVQEFEGYVADVKATVPVEFMCEDMMWKWKQTQITKSWKNASLKEIVYYVADVALFTGTIHVNDTDDLGGFVIDHSSAARVLKLLQEDYGFISYFRGNSELNVGLVAYPATYSTARYDFSKNIISSDLEYKGKEDVKLNVRAVSILEDNKKIEAIVGDKEGDERTLHFYNISSTDQLKKLAQAEYDKLIFDGYRGTFTTFGWPVVKHGDVADVNDAVYPERSGKYFIDTVRTTFGVDGFRREIELGTKAAA